MTASADGGILWSVKECSLFVENDAPRSAVSEPRLELRDAGGNRACRTAATGGTGRETLRLTDDRVGGSGGECAGQSECGESHIVKNGTNAPISQLQPPLNTHN